jgi:hypothetical protein
VVGDESHFTEMGRSAGSGLAAMVAAEFAVWAEIAKHFGMVLPARRLGFE